MKRLAHLIFIFLFVFFNGEIIIAQDWKYDLEEAKLQARKTDQNIVLFFTGSDWCPPCIKLEKNVFSNKDFIAFAKDNFVWLKADFPKRRKNRLSVEQQNKNEALASKYNKKWIFPVLLVLDKEAKVLGVTGYRRGFDANSYVSLLTSFNSFNH